VAAISKSIYNITEIIYQALFFLSNFYSVSSLLGYWLAHFLDWVDVLSFAEAFDPIARLK